MRKSLSTTCQFLFSKLSQSKINLSLEPAPKKKEQKLLNSTKGKIIDEQYLQYFNKNKSLFSNPLLIESGNLNYTARYIKTVLSQKMLTKDQKDSQFRMIKQSLRSKKVFTTYSCLNILQTLSKFNFDGDEQDILQKVRQFIRNDSLKFTNKEIEKIKLAYQQVMLEKAMAEVKLTEIKLKIGNEQQNLMQYLREVIDNNSMKKINLQNDKGKVLMLFQSIIHDKVRNIKLVGVDTNKFKEKDGLVMIEKENYGKNCQALVVIYEDFEEQQGKLLQSINSELSNHVFKNMEDIPEYDIPDFNKIRSLKDYAQFIKKLKPKKFTQKTQKFAIPINKISYIQTILKKRSLKEIRQDFGYLRMNWFHLQFQKWIKRMPQSPINTELDKAKFNGILNNLVQSDFQLMKMNVKYDIMLKEMQKICQLNPSLQSIVIYAANNDLPMLLKLLKCDSTHKQEENELIEQENSDKQLYNDKLAMLLTMLDVKVIGRNELNRRLGYYASVLNPFEYIIEK